jgi:uncharacterized protein (DUF433 family)
MTPLPSQLARKLQGLDRAATPDQPNGRDGQGQPHVFFDVSGSEEADTKPLLEQIQSNFLYLQRKLSASSTQIRQSVVIDSRIMHGNPVFSGTRVPLYRIIEELADGTRLEDLIEGYPTLSLEEIQVGLDFAASLLRIYND